MNVKGTILSRYLSDIGVLQREMQGMIRFLLRTYISLPAAHRCRNSGAISPNGNLRSGTPLPDTTKMTRAGMQELLTGRG